MTQPETPSETQPQTPSEDLIESEPTSARTTEIRRRLGLLGPASMTPRVVAGIAAATLVLGLAGGFLVGSGYRTQTTGALGLSVVAFPDINNIPFVDGGLPLDEGVIVFTVGSEYLIPEDLVEAGETTVLTGSEGFDFVSGLDGLCGNLTYPDRDPVPLPTINAISSVSFALDGATLTEHIGPDLGVLAASTLRGTVELAHTCGHSDGQTVDAEAVAEGIGDEYATFTVSSLNPVSGLVETSIVVLVRIGGRLIEISLAPDGGAEVPDGLARALRIAEIAVTRMLAG